MGPSLVLTIMLSYSWRYSGPLSVCQPTGSRTFSFTKLICHDLPLVMHQCCSLISHSPLQCCTVE